MYKKNLSSLSSSFMYICLYFTLLKVRGFSMSLSINKKGYYKLQCQYVNSLRPDCSLFECTVAFLKASVYTELCLEEGVLNSTEQFYDKEACRGIYTILMHLRDYLNVINMETEDADFGRSILVYELKRSKEAGCISSYTLENERLVYSSAGGKERKVDVSNKSSIIVELCIISGLLCIKIATGVKSLAEWGYEDVNCLIKQVMTWLDIP